MSEKYIEPIDAFRIEPAKKSKNVNFEDALEQTGFGRYNLGLILLCGTTLYAANTEAYSIGYVLPSAECDLDLNTSTKGILASTNFIGNVLTCCIWGCLSDRVGRKKILIVNLGLAFITSVIASVTPSFLDFAILRFLNGVFISGPSAIIFAYFGEFQSQSNKSKATAMMSTFIALALTTLPGLGWLILPKDIRFHIVGLEITSWRIFMFINGIPNLIAALGLCMYPESPSYLYHSGRKEEALRILEEMYTSNTKQPLYTYHVEGLEDVVKPIAGKPKSFMGEIISQILALFKAPLWKYIIAGCFMQATVFAISSGLFIWYPDIINQLALGKEDVELTVCDALSHASGNTDDVVECTGNVDSNIFIQNIIIGLSYIAGYSAWGMIVNLLGNRNVFIACMVLSTIAAIILCFVTQRMVIDIMFVMVLMLPGICVAVISSTMVEIIPTHLCGMAVCLSMTAGRLGSIVSSSIAGIMLQWNCVVTLMLYAASLVACLGIAFILPRKSANKL